MKDTAPEPAYCPYCGDSIKSSMGTYRCLSQGCRAVFFLRYSRQARKRHPVSDVPQKIPITLAEKGRYD